ncbi:MAG: enoyl-CoA hydratase/isomerase family protein [Flavobacteriales bacterium]|nr:enoyl-CoA hydratase/isomerase family protein [Flavobacteriales bacterium]
MESVTYENLLADVEAGILTLTINRPDKLNALNRATLEEIRSVVLEASDDQEVKGIIITGAGEKAFVAGADIKEFLDISPEEGKAFAANGQAIFKMIEDCHKPVIAAINGFALGGGCELAMACHLRVASENARFGQPEVNLGLIPGYGGTQRLIQYVGKTKAAELLMTGDMITGEEALKLGLLNALTSKEELMTKTRELLDKVLSKSPVAVKGVIRCLDAHFKDGEDGFVTEVEEFGKCFGTEDFKEGTSAFLEKRKPQFPGK